jgi:hypothetical protein
VSVRIAGTLGGGSLGTWRAVGDVKRTPNVAGVYKGRRGATRALGNRGNRRGGSDALTRRHRRGYVVVIGGLRYRYEYSI